MSWQATSYIKSLNETPSGSLITRSEKFVLLILADYHNTEQKGAWPSANTLSRDCQLTVRHVRRILASAKRKQVLCTSKRHHKAGGLDTNMYRFHQIDCGTGHLGGSDIWSLPSDINVTGVVAAESPGSDMLTPPVVTLVSSKDSTKRFKEPLSKESHTTTLRNHRAPRNMCVGQSKFSYEQIRK